MNFLDFLNEHQVFEGMQWIIVATVLLMFWKSMNAPDNNLNWWHYIATKAVDGNYYADLDKLGKATGIVIGSWALLKVSSNATIDFAGFALVLTAYFAFVGAIAGYSAYLRYKNDTFTGVVKDEKSNTGSSSTTQSK